MSILTEFKIPFRASEPELAPFGGRRAGRLSFKDPAPTPLPQVEKLKTNTELLNEINMNPDGVRIKSPVVDVKFLQRQYLRVFESFLDRADKNPNRADEFIERGLNYVKSKDKDLFKKLSEDEAFVEKRKDALKQEKKESTKRVSVRDIISRLMVDIPKDHTPYPAIKDEKKEDSPPISPIRSEILESFTEKFDQTFKVRELRAAARDRGVRGFSKMKKSDLIKALNE